MPVSGGPPCPFTDYLDNIQGSRAITKRIFPVRRFPKAWHPAASDRFRSTPESMFAPTSTVSGVLVLSRRVTHGTPRMQVSSWTPPESVRTSFACASRLEEFKKILGRDEGYTSSGYPKVLQFFSAPWVNGKITGHCTFSRGSSGRQ